MWFPFFIIMRILFVACMVFVIGYIFGGFSRRPSLAVITKVAAILLIVLFIASNAFFMRGGPGHFNGRGRCYGYDSVINKRW